MFFKYFKDLGLKCSKNVFFFMFKNIIVIAKYQTLGIEFLGI